MDLYVVTDCGLSIPCGGVIYGIFDNLEQAQECLNSINPTDDVYILKRTMNQNYKNEYED